MYFADTVSDSSASRFQIYLVPLVFKDNQFIVLVLSRVCIRLSLSRSIYPGRVVHNGLYMRVVNGMPPKRGFVSRASFRCVTPDISKCPGWRRPLRGKRHHSICYKANLGALTELPAVARTATDLRLHDTLCPLLTHRVTVNLWFCKLWESGEPRLRILSIHVADRPSNADLPDQLVLLTVQSFLLILQRLQLLWLLPPLGC